MIFEQRYISDLSYEQTERQRQDWIPLGLLYRVPLALLVNGSGTDFGVAGGAANVSQWDLAAAARSVHTLNFATLSFSKETHRYYSSFLLVFHCILNHYFLIIIKY